MSFYKILVDTNVCFDVLLNRAPYVASAQELIERAEFGDFTGVIAAHTFDTIFYVLNKQLNRREAYTGLRIIRSVFAVANVTQSTIDNALKLQWPDFEDAIHYQAALEAKCDVIVSRNKADFIKASLPVLSPHEFLSSLKQ
jgi:predicted nucleic acid-binding protein